MRRSAVALFSVILLFACHKSSGPAPATAFPNRVGDRWIYKYSPSGSPNADTSTIEVDIVGEMMLRDSETATIWVTKYSFDPSYPDTALVADSGAFVKVYYDDICSTCTNYMPTEWKRFHFPLQAGYEWISPSLLNDTAKVLTEQNVEVPAGNFPNSFEVANTIGYSVNSFTKDTIFITPGVGITKFFKEEFSLGPFPGNGQWLLSSWQLQ